MSEFSVERLLDIKEIEHLKSRYCRAIDHKQWDRLPDLFVPDARFEGFAAAPNGASVSVLVAGLAKRLEGSITVHHCHLPEIRVLSPTDAKGVWAMMDYNEWPAPIALPDFPEATGFCGYGFYEERYKRYEGSWRIEFMRLSRLRLDPLTQGARDNRFNPFVQIPGAMRPSPDWMSDPSSPA